MNKIKLWTKSLLFCLICCLVSANVAHAQVKSFANLYLELSLSDDVICLTSKTPTTDPLWAEAGITDVSKKLDELDDMGGTAILYDPQTKTSVMLLNKTSSNSKDIFNLGNATTEQKNDFYNTLTSGGTEDTSASISEFTQGDLTFFRLVIELSGDSLQREIIYGTIFNGTMIYFDLYDGDASAETDETFLQSLVSSVHFMKEYTPEEYDELTKQGLIRFALLILAVIVILIALVFLNRKRKANKEDKKKQFASALYHYYEVKKQKDAQGIKQKLLFTNHTTYSATVVRDFCFYNAYWKKLHFMILTILLYVLLLGFIYMNSGISILFIVVVVLLIAILYFQYYRVEKSSEYLWKTYANSSNKVAEFHFYEDYFTLSGIQYLSEYPYLQITDVKCHNGYIYLYTGNDRGLYLSTDGFEGDDAQEFLNYLNQYISSTRENYVKK